MMKRVFLAIATILMMCSTSSAQWVSPGDGSVFTMSTLVEQSNGAVTQEGNNSFTVSQDITISANDKLVIDNELSEINIGEVLVTIAGSLQCNNNNIVNVKPVDGCHYSFRFENAADNILNKISFTGGDGIQILESDIVISYCEFSGFSTGYTSSAINIHKCDPLIENCYFHDNEGAAIGSGANINGSPVIINNTFYNNVTANTNHPQINLGPGGNDTIFIINNIIEGLNSNMSGGISIADLTNSGTTKVRMSGNTIINNRYGYNQQGFNISSVIDNNIFTNNNLETNPQQGGSGISIYGMDNNCKAKIRNNIISGNLWGITSIYYNEIDLGTENDPGNNIFYGNGNNDTLYALYNNSFSDINAIGNYWGDNDPDFAALVIIDNDDNSGLGKVNYLPIKELYPKFLSFNVMKDNNNGLSQDYYGVIDEKTHTVTLNLVNETISMNNVIVDFEVSLGVTSDIESGTAMDFSNTTQTIILNTPHNESQEWTIILNNTLGVEESVTKFFNIYPNPSNGKFIIENIDESSTVSIISLEGKVLHVSKNNGMINCDLPAGLYFIKINDNKNEKIQKLIII